MLTDQDLISLMINEPSWEDVIVKIIAEEKMEPWNIDLIKLADVFGKYLARMGEMDLRVPARFILIAAILLRMKSDILIAKPEHKILSEVNKEQKDAELIRLLSQIPPLQAPVKRVPLGSVTMEELLTALRKAFEVKERREERKIKLRERVAVVLPHETQDITDRINKLYEQIADAIKDIEGSTTFKQLVKKWDRQDIVRTLTPMLHLSQEGKITYDQPVLFEEIIVKKKAHKVEA